MKKLTFRNKKKGISLALAGLMVALSGCNGNSVSTDASLSENSRPGGYVESELTIPDGADWTGEIKLRADGTLAYLDVYCMQAWASSDDGVSWTEEKPAILDQCDYENEYMSSSAVGADGSYFTESFLYHSTDNGGDPKTSYQYSNATGEASSVEISLWDGFIGKIQLDDEGRCYALSYYGEVFQIDGLTGEGKMLFQMNNGATSFAVCGDYIIASDYDRAYLYQISTETELDEPQALTQFLQSEGMNGDQYNLLNEYAHFRYVQAEDAFYILTRSGIYRYLLSDQSIEQVVDGSTNSISAPAHDIMGFEVLADGNFVVQYSGGQLMKYTYDPNMVSTVTTELVVYSLYDNETVAQAVVAYQKLHPEVKVRVEIGCSVGGQVTYEDALKNLNTELLSGEGPDIIVMDYLPLETYIEKGVLLDLSTCEDQWKPTENLYENLINTFSQENGMYAVPAKVSIPMLVGRSDSMEGITDLESFVDKAEEVHADSPDMDVIQEGYDPQYILRTLLCYCGNDLSDGTAVTQEELCSILTQAKRLYDMELDTAIPTDMFEYCETPEINALYGPTTEAKDVDTIGYGAATVAMQFSHYGTGCLSAISFEYENLVACNKQDRNTSMINYVEGEISDVEYINGMGQADNLYIPHTILGVVSTSEQQDYACDFIKTVLSSETQSIELTDGLPVNADALAQRFVYEMGPGAGIGCFGWDSYDGSKEYLFYTFVPTEEEQEQLHTMLGNLNCPVVIDEVTRATILELAPAYMKGDASLEDTAADIMDTISLRLAE